MIVTAVSRPTAVELRRHPRSGWITTYGIAAVQGMGEIAAAVAVGSALFAAFFVPPQRDGVLDVGGYRAMRWAAVAALVWAVASVVMIPLSLSNVSGLPLSETLAPNRWADALDQVADARRGCGRPSSRSSRRSSPGSVCAGGPRWSRWRCPC